MTLTQADLISRAEITDLIHRYAYNVRIGNPADSAMLFTENGIFEIRETDTTDLTAARPRRTLTGQDAIKQYLADTNHTDVKLCPLISNLLIEMDGNSASSSCVMTNRIWPGEKQMIGEYRDQFYRTNEWRFTSRVYTIFGAESAVQA